MRASRVMILKDLAELGSGFDCASVNEFKHILNIGIGQNRIIYANHTKQVS